MKKIKHYSAKPVLFHMNGRDFAADNLRADGGQTFCFLQLESLLLPLNINFPAQIMFHPRRTRFFQEERSMMAISGGKCSESFCSDFLVYRWIPECKQWTYSYWFCRKILWFCWRFMVTISISSPSVYVVLGYSILHYSNPSAQRAAIPQHKMLRDCCSGDIIPIY